MFVILSSLNHFLILSNELYSKDIRAHIIQPAEQIMFVSEAVTWEGGPGRVCLKELSDLVGRVAHRRPNRGALNKTTLEMLFGMMKEAFVKSFLGALVCLKTTKKLSKL